VVFMQSAGRSAAIFGGAFCPPGIQCEALSCHEKETVSGHFRDATEGTATAHAEWTFDATWRQRLDGDPPRERTFNANCVGSSDGTLTGQ
jgi:hypothetical protein